MDGIANIPAYNQKMELKIPKDEHLHVIYINEKVNRDEWHTYEVGKTRFNDEALRQAGEY